MRARLLVAMVVAAAVGASAGLAAALDRTGAPSSTSGTAGLATPGEPAAPQRRPAQVGVDTPGYWSWALLDRRTQEITGGPEQAGTNSTESMIKVWIVADRLRRLAERGPEVPADVLARASAAIRDSDDAAAQRLYLDGGGDEVIRRLTDICRLTGTTIHPGWWSRTEMPARDAVRMGQCVADGRAAGPRWTGWLLEQMRRVRGSADPADQPGGGRWGIIEALPESQARRLAIKNGWTPVWADGRWHVNCLAIADGWILAVQARYPVELGLAHGAWVCREAARQVLARWAGNQVAPGDDDEGQSTP